jgi:hypothetical protein
VFVSVLSLLKILNVYSIETRTDLCVCVRARVRTHVPEFILQNKLIKTCLKCIIFCKSYSVTNSLCCH